MCEVPTEPDKLQDWMYKLYEEKDGLLDEYYKTGSFPEVPEDRRSKAAKRLVKPKHVNYGAHYIIFIQVLFAGLAYVQYLFFKSVYNFIF